MMSDGPGATSTILVLISPVLHSQDLLFQIKRNRSAAVTKWWSIHSNHRNAMQLSSLSFSTTVLKSVLKLMDLSSIGVDVYAHVCHVAVLLVMRFQRFQSFCRTIAKAVNVCLNSSPVRLSKANREFWEND